MLARLAGAMLIARLERGVDLPVGSRQANELGVGVTRWEREEERGL